MSAAQNTTADILTAAADLIDKPGAWAQGLWLTQTYWANRHNVASPCLCAEGALAWVMDLSDPDKVYNTPAALALRALLPRDVGGIADWNDAPERTQAEVVAALRAAAAKATTAVEPNSVGTPQGVNQND